MSGIERNFRSAKALLARAQFNGRLLEARQEELNARDDIYHLFKERDPRTGKTLFKARIASDIPIEFSVLVFDIINELRSSLDHAVFDAVSILGGKANPKYTKFPFAKTKRDAAKDLQRKNAPVPHDLAKFLLKFKPYQRGNRALWAMNELRNGKIHRTLTAMAVATRQFEINPVNGAVYIQGLHIEGGLLSRWNSRKRELTYLEASRAEHIHGKFKITVNITFDNGTPFAGKPAVAALHEIFSICVGIVNAIEAETNRLKEK